MSVSLGQAEAVVAVLNACTPAGVFEPAAVAADARERLRERDPALLAAWEAEHGPEWFLTQSKAVRRSRSGRKAYETRQANKARRFEEAWKTALSRRQAN